MAAGSAVVSPRTSSVSVAVDVRRPGGFGLGGAGIAVTVMCEEMADRVSIRPRYNPTPLIWLDPIRGTPEFQ